MPVVTSGTADTLHQGEMRSSALICSVLFLALVVIIVRSFFVEDQLNRFEWGSSRQITMQFNLRRGMLIGAYSVTYQRLSNPEASFVGARLPILNNTWIYQPSRLSPTEGWRYIRWLPSILHHGINTAIVVPLWIGALICAAVPLAWAIRQVARRKVLKGGLCPACGYDLRATPERCPECGAIPVKK